MKLKNSMLFLAVLMAFTAFLVSSGTIEAADYVGDTACQPCHTGIYDDYKKTGHPYKLRITDGKTPIASGTPTSSQILDPLSALLTMPNYSELLNPNNETNIKGSGTLEWSKVSYVIGGYGQKARWGVKDTVDGTATGFIWSSTVSSPTGAQFNMLAADTTLDGGSDRSDWSTYGSATKKYHCAVCHNTNGTTSIDSGCITPLDSGRPKPWDSVSGVSATSPGGFAAEWSLDGVQCEECHGPGSIHVSAPSATPMTVNKSKDLCGKCHVRSGNAKWNDAGTLKDFGSECGAEAAFPATSAILTGGAPASENNISHHEQYNEMVGVNGDGVHAKLNCVTCHNPHKRVTKVTSAIANSLGISTVNNANLKPETGAVISCSSCHGQYLTKDHPAAAITCVDCHMSEAIQTGTTVAGDWGRKGDIKNHVFKIDPAQSTLTRTNSAGKTVAKNAIGLKFACGKCHDSNSTKEEIYNKGGKTYANLAAAQAEFTGAGRYVGGIHISGTDANNATARFNWYAGSACYTANLDGSMNTAATTFAWSTTGAGCSISPADASVATLTCTAAGTVQVTLKVDGTVSRTMAVTVKGNTTVPDAKMEVNNCVNATPACTHTDKATGMVVRVSDNASAAASCGAAANTGTATILWGDGTTDVVSDTPTANASKEHKYNVPGSYTIRYSYRDSNGNKSMSAPQTITVPEVGTATCAVTGVITGTAILENTMITLKKGGTVVKQGKTNNTGRYTIPGVQAGITYTVVPSRNGYSFSPGDRTFTLDCSSNTDRDFTATVKW